MNKILLFLLFLIIPFTYAIDELDEYDSDTWDADNINELSYNQMLQDPYKTLELWDNIDPSKQDSLMESNFNEFKEKADSHFSNKLGIGFSGLSSISGVQYSGETFINGDVSLNINQIPIGTTQIIVLESGGFRFMTGTNIIDLQTGSITQDNILLDSSGNNLGTLDFSQDSSGQRVEVNLDGDIILPKGVTFTDSFGQKITSNADNTIISKVGESYSIKGKAFGSINYKGQQVEFETSKFFSYSSEILSGTNSNLKFREVDLISKEISGKFVITSGGISMSSFSGRQSKLIDFDNNIEISTTGHDLTILNDKTSISGSGNLIYYDEKSIVMQGAAQILRDDLKVSSKDSSSRFIQDKNQIKSKGILEVENKDFEFNGLTKTTIFESTNEGKGNNILIDSSSEGKIAEFSKKVEVITMHDKFTYLKNKKSLKLDIENKDGNIIINLGKSGNLLSEIENADNQFILSGSNLNLQLGDNSQRKLVVDNELGIIYENERGDFVNYLSPRRVESIIGDKLVPTSERIKELKKILENEDIRYDLEKVQTEIDSIEYFELENKLKTSLSIKDFNFAKTELENFLEEHPNSQINNKVKYALTRVYLSDIIENQDETSLKKALNNLNNLKNDETYGNSAKLLLARVSAMTGNPEVGLSYLSELENNGFEISGEKLELEKALINKKNEDIKNLQPELMKKFLEKIGGDPESSLDINLISGLQIASSDFLDESFGYKTEIKEVEEEYDALSAQLVKEQIGLSYISRLQEEGYFLEDIRASSSDPQKIAQMLGSKKQDAQIYSEISDYIQLALTNNEVDLSFLDKDLGDDLSGIVTTKNLLIGSTSLYTGGLTAGLLVKGAQSLSGFERVATISSNLGKLGSSFSSSRIGSTLTTPILEGTKTSKIISGTSGIFVEEGAIFGATTAVSNAGEYLLDSNSVSSLEIGSEFYFSGILDGLIRSKSDLLLTNYLSVDNQIFYNANNQFETILRFDSSAISLNNFNDLELIETGFYKKVLDSGEVNLYVADDFNLEDISYFDYSNGDLLDSDLIETAFISDQTDSIIDLNNFHFSANDEIYLHKSVGAAATEDPFTKATRLESEGNELGAYIYYQEAQKYFEGTNEAIFADLKVKQIKDKLKLKSNELELSAQSLIKEAEYEAALRDVREVTSIKSAQVDTENPTLGGIYYELMLESSLSSSKKEELVKSISKQLDSNEYYHVTSIKHLDSISQGGLEVKTMDNPYLYFNNPQEQKASLGRGGVIVSIRPEYKELYTFEKSQIDESLEGVIILKEGIPVESIPPKHLQFTQIDVDEVKKFDSEELNFEFSSSADGSYNLEDYWDE